MPKKNSYPTATDQFCGAGGSSQGAKDAGVEVKLALNHWKLAIETHNTNFPDTLHDCTDISASDPRRYPSTDILITSPECTNHSLAKGQKVVKSQMDLFASGKLDAAAERSRATMWDVCRFAEYHNYNAIIVENVVDARKWIMWDAWLTAMHALGYLHKCLYLNSQHAHPTPQSRDRMYVIFWKKGNKAPELDYYPLANCNKCGKDVQAVQTWKNPLKRFGKYKQQYVYCCPVDGAIVEPYYYAAFNCIDWSDIGKRIGDRKKPLSTNTINRINYGLDKYEKEPFIMHAAYSDQARGVVRSIGSAAFTQTTFLSQVIVQQPFIIKGEHTKVEPQVRGVSEAMQTQVTRQTMSLCTPPFIVNYHHSSKTDDLLKAMPCQTTLEKYGLVTSEAWNAFIGYNRSQWPSHILQPVQTVATVEQLSVVQYQKPALEDCYYRMLAPKEIQAAMAFAADYKVLGSGKEQVKQLGNAVTPPAMKWIIKQVLNSFN